MSLSSIFSTNNEKKEEATSSHRNKNNERIKILFSGRHNNEVTSVIYFGSPIYKIVSSDDSSQIKIFSSITFIYESMLTDHYYPVNQVIKWDEKTFISGSNDRTIKFYEFPSSNNNNNNNKIKKPKLINSHLFSEFITQMVKLDDEHLLLMHLRGDLLIFSFSQQKVISTFNCFQTSEYKTKLILSNIYDSSIYVNSNPYNAKNSILLINWKQKTEISERIIYENFFQDSSGFEIPCITVFMNHKNEEILVSLGIPKKIIFYNFGSFSSEKNLKKNLKKIKPFLMFQLDCGILMVDQPISCDILRNKYLFLGDSSGKISISDVNLILEKNKNKNKNFPILTKMMHEDTVNRFYFLDDDNDNSEKEKKEKNNEKNGIKFLSCSNDGRVKLSLVKGLSFENNNFLELQKQDFEERVSFIREKIDEFLFKNKENERNILFCINLKNKKFRNIFKVLLMI